MSDINKRPILIKTFLFNFIFAPLNHLHSGRLLLAPLVLAGFLALVTVFYCYCCLDALRSTALGVYR